MAQTLIHEAVHLIGSGFTDEVLGAAIKGGPLIGKTPEDRQEEGSPLINSYIEANCRKQK